MFYSLSRWNRPKPELIKLSPLLASLEELKVSIRSSDRLENWGSCGIPILSIRATDLPFWGFSFPFPQARPVLAWFLPVSGRLPVSIQAICYPEVFPLTPFIEESLFLLCTEKFFLYYITESQLLFHIVPIIYCKVFDKCIFFYFITLKYHNRTQTLSGPLCQLKAKC